jgi:hypothetical protein
MYEVVAASLPGVPTLATLAAVAVVVTLGNPVLAESTTPSLVRLTTRILAICCSSLSFTYYTYIIANP